MDKTDKKKFFKNALIIIVILVSVSIMLFRSSYSFAYKQVQSVKTDQGLPDTTLIDSQPPNTQGSIQLNKILLPIFMYHYVRNYNNPDDEAGINLSVSPSVFASQLDLIISKGYGTTNFYEISKGNIPAKPIILTFDDGYKDFFTAAYPELKKRGMTAVVFVIADKKTDQYLDEAQIKELSSNGIEIGAHTISHINLLSIPINKAREEILTSRQILEGMVGKSIISFCYPAGKYNDAIVNEVKNDSYRYAVTTESGIADFADPYVLRRFRITNTTHISAYLK